MTSRDVKWVLFNRSPVPVVLLDEQGVIRETNAAADEAFGVDRDRSVGKPLLGRVLPADRDRLRALVTGEANGKAPIRFRRGNGSTRALVPRLETLDLPGSGHRYLLFLSDFQSLTRDGPGELELRPPDDLVDDQFTLVLDLRGVIREMEGVERVHRLDPRELRGRALASILRRDPTGNEVAEEMLDASARGERWKGIQWHRRGEGIHFPALIRTTPRLDPETGRIVGTLLVGRDVEEEFRWRSQAEEHGRLASVGSLVLSLAHEVGSHLGEKGEDPRPEGVEAARALLDRLQDFTSRPEPDPVRIEVERLASDAIDLLPQDTGAPAPSLRLAPELAAESVVGDPGLLARALAHLLENALDAVKEGGGAGEVALEGERMPGGWVRFRVRDSGPGMDPGTRDGAFEPFFTRRPGRFGLGLPLARRMAELHGGRCVIEASGREGTSVLLELPPAPRGELPLFHAVPLSLGVHRSVLLVDDEEAVRYSLRRVLERLGYEVREAWSGRSALAELLADGEPDLLVTDLKMSEGSGYWLMDRLQEDYPGLLARTIVVTGDADMTQLAHLRDRTGCAVLPKPLDLPTFIQALGELASG